MSYFALEITEAVSAWYYTWPTFARYVITQVMTYLLPVAVGLITLWKSNKAEKNAKAAADFSKHATDAVYPNHGSSLHDKISVLIEKVAQLEAKNDVWHPHG
jgi:hypothetical protein